MTTVVMDQFSGNPERWVLQAELYFSFLGFPKKYWLSLPYHYLEGNTLNWFNGLYRNKQFWDWNHFTEKLLLHCRNRPFTAKMGRLVALEAENSMVDQMFVETPVTTVNTQSHSPDTFCTDGGNSATAVDKVFDEIPHTEVVRPFQKSVPIIEDREDANLDKSQNSMPACSRQFVESQSCLKVATCLEDEPEEEEGVVSEVHSDLLDGISNPEANSEAPLERFKISIGNSSNSFQFALLVDSTGCIGTIDTPLDTKVGDTGNSQNDAAKVLDKSPQFDHLLETNRLSSCRVIPRHVIAQRVLIHFPFDPGSYKLPTICHLVSSHNFESHISFEGIAQQSRGLVAKLYVCESVNGVAIGVGSSWDEALEFNEYARGGTHGSYEIVPVDTCIILLWKVDSGLRYIDKYLHNKASTFSDQHFLIPFSFNPDASMLLFTPGESALAICVWDPGICSTSFAITGYIENRHALPMLGSTAIVCLIAYSNSMTKVWDPGRQQCVHSFILQFDSDVSIPKSSTSGLFFNDGGELSPEIILSWGKKLFILLLPLYDEHQVRQSNMNTYEKCVLTVIPEAFRSSLTDSCFRGILGARSYNEGDHTFSNGPTVGYIYIALIAIKQPLPSVIVDLQANQNDRFNIVEVVNKLFLKEVHAYSSKVLFLGCILLEDILYIRLMTPQTMNHLVVKAEHFAVHMLQALSKSWPTNLPNRQLQVKINVERSSSQQFMDTIIVLTKSKSYGWNTYNSTLLQEVQGFTQLHCAKLDKHLWRIFWDSSLFPFDLGGFLHIQFNSKRKMSDTRLNAMISVLFLNLEDKVLIRHGGIVMNENSYSFVEGILENLANYLWDPG